MRGFAYPENVKSELLDWSEVGGAKAAPSAGRQQGKLRVDTGYFATLAANV
jgi:hypothetical protein